MLHIEGSHFKDEQGRTRMLRGVNLGGSSKLPAGPNGATYVREGFFEHRGVTFIGRPFPLAEADEHFRRLRRWGLTFLRFLVTWEGIEHAGPGLYDEEYLDYVRALVVKAGEYGLMLFIDPHQDVWSRFSGGDGAPGWTLEAVGFDLTHFHETGAAIVHATHGDPFPRMVWPSNGAKLAAATMFTLFFAGNDFAVQTKIEGEPAQEFLQRHYFQSMQRLAERLAGLEQVLGYDTLNEPLAGYIGWKDLRVPGGTLLLGDCPSPYQAMLLGEGIPQEVGVWEMKLASIERTGSRLLNAGQQRAWRAGCGCIWREHGVWDRDAAGQAHLLRPDYFAQAQGRAVSFAADYYPPFAEKFAAAMHAVDPRAMIFLEGEGGEKASEWRPCTHQNLVFAPHWYDAFVLLKKAYTPLLAVNSQTEKPVWLPWNIRRSFAEQLASFKRVAIRPLGGVPVVLGEFGVPFDLDHKLGYRTGDFRAAAAALDRSFQALEANLLHGTLWNYTSDNTNQHGDLWNDEDLSIFSQDQAHNPADPDSGGRALGAVVRPYPVATAGEPLRLVFDMRRRTFEYVFRHDPAISAPTEIFVPQIQYPRGCVVSVSDGQFEMDAAEQMLRFWHSDERVEHTIRVKPEREKAHR
ncbi:MAG TPA: cellulase family glycosylhydrolase [Anaerolineaceae bacterium]